MRQVKNVILFMLDLYIFICTSCYDTIKKKIYTPHIKYYILNLKNISKK